uniref:Rad60/SUMO-like domain-containing protein n=1 Tax=Chromera velia CCMP2878 TaxID=1169474 RepID=A0A0G4FPG9_9ALVE|eukprot:Cvel_18096.t1-p1 / transcript=Cvel_18096.t1 / gene=Cvel_18096 / organism=Chromera_velia_CCMP2878 / gene_product=hypothetical protein / transcript_product=hypothetical protein / location=Cvel_scaffold1483:16383-19421(-) / protein_length=533 / sequence_SO=supercontig / SO=protein_coding / is_pseudo=false
MPPREKRGSAETLLKSQQEQVKELYRLIRARIDCGNVKKATQRWASSEDEQQKMLDGYTRCLSLKALLGDGDADLLSMPFQLVSLWHEHVLETKKYMKLMKLLLSKHGTPFLHHSSEVAGDDAALQKRFVKMRSVYECFFPNADMSAFDRWDKRHYRANSGSLVGGGGMGGSQEQPEEREGGGEEEEPECPPTGSGGERINVQIRMEAEGVLTEPVEAIFCIKTTSRLKKLTEAFCAFSGCTSDSVTFWFDGKTVKQSQTPIAIGLKNGDTLYAHQAQSQKKASKAVHPTAALSEIKKEETGASALRELGGQKVKQKTGGQRVSTEETGAGSARTKKERGRPRPTKKENSAVASKAPETKSVNQKRGGQGVSKQESGAGASKEGVSLSGGVKRGRGRPPLNRNKSAAAASKDEGGKGVKRKLGEVDIQREETGVGASKEGVSAETKRGRGRPPLKKDQSGGTASNGSGRKGTKKEQKGASASIPKRTVTTRVLRDRGSAARPIPGIKGIRPTASASRGGPSGKGGRGGRRQGL